MLLTTTGFDNKCLTPNLSELLGDGNGLMNEAAFTNCEMIEPVHFLCFLVRTQGTVIRTRYLDTTHCDTDNLCDHIYRRTLPQDNPPGMPIEFGLNVMSETSQQMLTALEEINATWGGHPISEELLLFILLDHVGDKALSLLQAVSDMSRFTRFREELGRVSSRHSDGARVSDNAPPTPFDSETGIIQEAMFDKSGRQVLCRLREETMGTGAEKATALHLLYSMAGLNNGLLQRALRVQAIDPVGDVYAPLGRVLVKPGGKRANDYVLSQVTLHDSVVRIIDAAAMEAYRQGLGISEQHIAQALMNAPPGLVTEFLISRKAIIAEIQAYLADGEIEAEEQASYLNLPLAQIETELRSKILGQDEALRRILPWVKRLRFGFPKERGPAAVFLFLGPSGTGKTQLAKELARTVYGSEDELVMLEMGQFNSKESINIFIGAPPGYIGYGEGKLTNGLRDRPRSVVLFDEVEKAHEDVWVALMRFLDEGLISDPAGPTRDGRQCIIVLTSNLGADSLAKLLPADSAEMPYQAQVEMEQAIRDTVLPYLKRPEIYNRVDDKVVFRPFGLESYRALLVYQLTAEIQKFYELRNVKVEVLPEVLDWLSQCAFDARQEGARCVPRLINSNVVVPVIDLITANEDRHIPLIYVSKRGDSQGVIAQEA